ncbi:DUF4388 domain-containing protein [Anaeromyxobacter diazotrophicus]|uniref:PatA-like N-terminal domain-containing protein n=1 Tax=Anaeromyxobacter diazotrophicus TaxID=2590199 RepID=A0A7I9VTC8_9BACT|nr:DUF4388 domain-containing protein [Anaeromyxobacter diazotrophicus]GEJ59390.1 hypothetical protein AMYX_41310 [Anaeromyxobacter diazotrophicus]
MRGLMGTFALMPLGELVEFLARRRASGSLSCERGTVKKTVFLVEGVAVGAASNDPREYLGQLLMNFGHITEEQLAKAFQTQEETKIRLGKVLTMVGVVTPEVIRDTLGIKIRETLLDAFVWDSGVFRVDETPPPAPDELDPRVPLADLAREAEFRTTAWQAFRAQFPSGTAALVVDEAKVPPDLAPGSVDRRLLELAREGKTIDELGLALHATDFHLYQRLYALHRQGVLSAGASPSAAPGPDPEGAEPEASSADAAARQLREELLDPPRTPRLKVRAHEVALMRLTAAEKYLLGRCDGSRDLRQIIQLAPLTELEVLRSVKKFVEGRLLELG